MICMLICECAINTFACQSTPRDRLHAGSGSRLTTFCTPSCRKLSAKARIRFRLFKAFHFLVNSTDAYSVPLNIKWLSFGQQAVTAVGTRSRAAQTHAGRAKILSTSQHQVRAFTSNTRDPLQCGTHRMMCAAAGQAYTPPQRCSHHPVISVLPQGTGKVRRQKPTFWHPAFWEVVVFQINHLFAYKKEPTYGRVFSF